VSARSVPLTNKILPTLESLISAKLQSFVMLHCCITTATTKFSVAGKNEKLGSNVSKPGCTDNQFNQPRASQTREALDSASSGSVLIYLSDILRSPGHDLFKHCACPICSVGATIAPPYHPVIATLSDFDHRTTLKEPSLSMRRDFLGLRASVFTATGLFKFTFQSSNRAAS